MNIIQRFNLNGSVAVITGGGRGIGRGIALAYAEAGADVVLAARTLGDVEAVAEEVRSLGRRALALSCDVNDSEQRNALVTQARADGPHHPPGEQCRRRRAQRSADPER